MRSKREIRNRFAEMKERVEDWDEEDVEALYEGQALAWVLMVKAPEIPEKKKRVNIGDYIDETADFDD